MFTNYQLLLQSINLKQILGNEIDLLTNECKALGANVVLSDVWANGGNGGIELAKEVINLCEKENNFTFSYTSELSIKDKSTVFDCLYGGEGNISYPCTLGEFVNEIITRHNLILETPDFPFSDFILDNLILILILQLKES